MVDMDVVQKAIRLTVGRVMDKHLFSIAGEQELHQIKSELQEALGKVLTFQHAVDVDYKSGELKFTVSNATGQKYILYMFRHAVYDYNQLT